MVERVGFDFLIEQRELAFLYEPLMQRVPLMMVVVVDMEPRGSSVDDVWRSTQWKRWSRSGAVTRTQFAFNTHSVTFSSASLTFESFLRGVKW